MSCVPHLTNILILITLPLPSGSWFHSGCKAGDSGLCSKFACGRVAESQGGTLNTFWAVRYGVPCQTQAGVTSANVGQEAPHRFSGYSTVAPAIGDPHTPSH